MPDPRMLGRLLGTIHRYARMNFQEALARIGFPEPALPYYMALLEADGLRQDELTGLCHRDPATTTRAVTRLEELGLVVRDVPADDRRAKKVTLTQKGRDMAPAVCAILDDWTRTLADGLTDEEVATTLKLLQHMADNACRAVDGEPYDGHA